MLGFRVLIAFFLYSCWNSGSSSFTVVAYSAISATCLSFATPRAWSWLRHLILIRASQQWRCNLLYCAINPRIENGKGQSVCDAIPEQTTPDYRYFAKQRAETSISPLPTFEQEGGSVREATRGERRPTEESGDWGAREPASGSWLGAANKHANKPRSRGALLCIFVALPEGQINCVSAAETLHYP